MKANKQTIEYLANLAQIEISEEEKQKYSQQLSSILDYFSQLNELDTNEMAPLAQVSDLENVLREDEVKEQFSGEKTLAAVPALQQRQVQVPPVFTEK